MEPTSRLMDEKLEKEKYPRRSNRKYRYIAGGLIGLALVLFMFHNGDKTTSVQVDTGVSEEYPNYDSLMNSPLKSDTEVNQEIDENPEEQPVVLERFVNVPLYKDQEAYDNAPFIQVREPTARKFQEIVHKTELFYKENPTRLYVPRLRDDIQLTPEEFHELFTKRHKPVILSFEAMRHLGFTTKAHTLEDLQKIYPNTKPKVYKYGQVITKEIDLGPAIATLMTNSKLRKTTEGRNYPRNMKIRPSKMSKLDIHYPPFKLPSQGFMLPSLWFGATSSSTPFHQDCCDNFAVMIAGTKRWNLAPPSEARMLLPHCTGGLCWVKQLVHADDHANELEKEVIEKTQLVDIELHPGEMLFLPQGWFHHVENMDPTIMVNFWTTGKNTGVKI